MSSGAGQGVNKRAYPPFKPPRPRNSTTAPATASGSKSKSKPRASTSKPSASSRKRQSRQKSLSVDPEPESNDDEGPESQASSPRSLSSFEEPEYILAEITAPTNENEGREAIDSADPAIPPKLLTRLLHHHFQSDKTKVAKDANRVVAKYVDIFVREALARAAYERQEENRQADAAGGRRGLADGFLEVEDLEKLAPQLVLDF